MPRSATAPGCVDFVLPLDQIAAELSCIVKHPYAMPCAAPDLSKIARVPHKIKEVDFLPHKFNTLYRRISVRMILHRVNGLPEYAELLRSKPEEVRQLVRMCSSASPLFSAHPKVFETLKTNVLLRLIAGRPPGEPLRIRVVGCSPGDEV